MGVKDVKSLKELTEAWMAMERKTFAQRRRAEAYYEKYYLQFILYSFYFKSTPIIT